MKKNFFNFLSLALVGVILFACGNPTKMAESADSVSVECAPQVLEAVAGKIQAKVTINFPAEFFHPKGIIEVVPVLVYNGGEIAGDAIMYQGEEVTNNHKVIAEMGATVVEDLTFDYIEGMEQAHLELRMAVLYNEDRVAFAAPYKIADGTNTTYMLASKKGALAYAPDAYQAVIPEQGEAQILYLINSATVRPAQLRTDQIEAFQEFLAGVKADERRTVKNTEIIAYASPDGKESFNEKLSEKRAVSAGKAFKSRINRKVDLDTPIESVSVSEDWAGFKELVKNSDIHDKDLIIRVLEMYSDPVVREREIKNMSQVFTILAKEILPQLRRARFITHIDYANYSDEELIALVNDNIEILDEEALLHAATLIKDDNKKVSVYTKAVDKFNSDRAKINLAVTYLKLDNVANAQTALNRVSDKGCYYYNTLGVIDLRKGNNEAAAANFAKSKLKEAKYNLGTIDIFNGKYADAYAKLSGSKSCNEPLAAILIGNLEAASAALKGSKCPIASYLKAIVAARQGNVAAAQADLKVASENAELAKRAQTDIEFAKVR